MRAQTVYRPVFRDVYENVVEPVVSDLQFLQTESGFVIETENGEFLEL